MALLAAVSIAITGPATTSQYEKAEYTITVQGGEWSNAHLQEEAAVDMTFVAPDGTTGTLPCFYSGTGSSWTARFAPARRGTYSISFTYRQDGKPAAESPAQSLVVRKSSSKGFLHPRDCWTLQYESGEPFRGVGENLCWESRAADDNPHLSELHQRADLYNYDVMLPKLAKNGGNFTRMWMCSWNFPIDRKDDFNNRRYTPSEEYFNPSAVARLDHVIGLAEELDIKIMLCMGQGDVTADEAFFTGAAQKARYRNRLRYIVARWGYSTSIAMWEFFNEIDNIQFQDEKNPIPAEAIVQWHREMSAYLRSIDPYGHIITTSISHRDLEGLNSVKDIDINQKHIYRGTSSIPSTILDYEKRFGKPYVIGEAGFEWDWYKDFEKIADGMDMDFTRAMYYGLFNPTPVVPMSWWWEWFERRGTDRRIAEVRKLSEKMLSEGGGSFEPLPVEVSGHDGYAVRCGKKVFVYIFNPTDSPVKSFKVDLGGGKTIVRKGLNILPNKEQTFIL